MVDKTKGANLSPRESGAYYQETTIQHGKMTRELQTIQADSVLPGANLSHNDV